MCLQKNVDPIPEEFASYEEAAEFWDTHDTTDYPNSFETVAIETELKCRRYEAV
ncbi:MAG TPA: CopG family antitoxin [Pyrinomonadaceae bacterium]|jgi:predicted transcriptional regulator|nr:CopG family antitoxin [Pyrinomonadaceae bacterium]